jgi:hypothetical protein
LVTGQNLREELIRVVISQMNTNEGPTNKTITINGYRTYTFSGQKVRLYKPTYKALTNGKFQYRFAVPHPYLQPADLCLVEGDQFPVDYITFNGNASRITMDVFEGDTVYSGDPSDYYGEIPILVEL